MEAATTKPRDHRYDRGATAVEYSVIVALIAAVIVLAVESVGVDTLDLWGRISW